MEVMSHIIKKSREKLDIFHVQGVPKSQNVAYPKVFQICDLALRLNNQHTFAVSHKSFCVIQYYIFITLKVQTSSSILLAVLMSGKYEQRSLRPCILKWGLFAFHPKILIFTHHF